MYFLNFANSNEDKKKIEIYHTLFSRISLNPYYYKNILTTVFI